ncbi:hypothetical protein QFZ71_004218 [Streptomyces sp. V2I9]|nr:hypothetical protein [Streptomyces sp. V2I9]
MGAGARGPGRQLPSGPPEVTRGQLQRLTSTFSSTPRASGTRMGGGVVRRHQVGDDRLFVDAHEADREARLDLVGDAGLLEADDALFGLAGPHADDGGGAGVGDGDLVGREDRHPAPGGHVVAADVDALGDEPAAVALAAEGGDGLGVGEEQLRAAAAREQFVQVVGAGRAVVRLDPLPVVAVVEQAELLVVDEFVLLALAQRLDREPQLLLGLVHRLVVEVGDPAVHLQHGLRDAQFVLAGRGVVVDEGVRDDRFADMAGGEVDRRLAVAVGALLRDGEQAGEVALQGCGALREVVHVGAAQGQERARGDGAGGVLPDGLAVDQALVTEIRAVREDSEVGLVPVGAGADLRDLAVRQQEDPVRRVAGCGEHLPRGHVALLAAAGELGEDLLVAEVPQGGQLSEFRGDHGDPVPGLNEGHPAVADRIAEPTVHPVRAALHLHPGQHLQQPPGGDLLHLRRGLGGRREVPRSRRPQTLLRRRLRVANLFTNGHLTSSRSWADLRPRAFQRGAHAAITQKSATNPPPCGARWPLSPHDPLNSHPAYHLSTLSPCG